MVEIVIGQIEAGKKVHRLVRQLLPGVPLSGVHKMIRTGRIKRNGKRAHADDIVQVGDIIRLYMAEADYKQVSKPVKKFAGVSTDVDVLYEDADLLAVNKPVGLLIHGAEGEYKDTLVNRVLAYLHQRDELTGRQFTPSPVNRLDRNTSGIVVFAKTGEAARVLTQSIAAHETKKCYVALVRGRLDAPGEIKARLERVDDQHTRVSARGKESLTRFTPVVGRGGTTVVDVELISGRTHQIRAHFRHIDHPLVGDVKYGGAAPRAREQDGLHQWLHAAVLIFPTGLRLYAPLPVEFLNTLRSYRYSEEDLRRIESHFAAQAATS